MQSNSLCLTLIITKYYVTGKFERTNSGIVYLALGIGIQIQMSRIFCNCCWYVGDFCHGVRPLARQNSKLLSLRFFPDLVCFSTGQSFDPDRPKSAIKIFFYFRQMFFGTLISFPRSVFAKYM